MSLVEKKERRRLGQDRTISLKTLGCRDLGHHSEKED